ncbi:MAG: ribonuclease [Gammaproteobacteria bacterium]|jgi:ribonuclease HII|nr:ribonuclease [Gammaproteobacteria bacterium]
MDLTQFGINNPDVCIAGVDEVGRGPLAGPVVAAAVILDKEVFIAGIKDSKQLSPGKRRQLDLEIRDKALSVAIGWAEVEEIDRLNILQAALLAMKRAVDALTLKPALILVDGNRCPRWSYESHAIIGGDQKVPAISAASIVAKVYRDQKMIEYHDQFPQYGFNCHMGYGTLVHRQALQQYGPCVIHRRSFAPVKEVLTAE